MFNSYTPEQLADFDEEVARYADRFFESHFADGQEFTAWERAIHYRDGRRIVFYYDAQFERTNCMERGLKIVNRGKGVQ